ncbi:MAG TPA: hypothetical protein VF041_02515 [Gemmatimonadaceae bacterium]
MPRSTVVAEFSHGSMMESARPGEPHAWRVFFFESAPARLAT